MILFPFFFFFVYATYAMQESNIGKIEDYFAFVVPGASGLGGESFEGIINTSEKNTKNCGTLYSLYTDLGQGNCIEHFAKQLKVYEDVIEKMALLISGISQGTATVINWLAQQPLDVQERVGVLILESVVESGNSAILYTIENGLLVSRKYPLLKAACKATSYLPFARVWLPLTAKIMFPTYNPWGKQAIDAVEKISNRIPVIIMHNIHDQQTSIDGAIALYLKFLENQNDVYLFTANQEGRRDHFNIINIGSIDDKKMKLGALQEIYKKHNLPINPIWVSKISEEQLKQFQPDGQELQQQRRSSQKKTFLRNSIDGFSGVIILGIAAYLAYNSLLQLIILSV